MGVNFDLDFLRSLNEGAGGDLTWPEIVDLYKPCDEKGVRLTSEALRKRAARRRHALERMGIDIAQTFQRNQATAVIEDLEEDETEEGDTEPKINKFAPRIQAVTDDSESVDTSDDSDKTVSDVIEQKTGLKTDTLITQLESLMREVVMDALKKEMQTQHPVSQVSLKPVNKFATGASRAAMYEESNEDLDDTEKFETALLNLSKKQAMVTVVVATDIHLPDHSIRALKTFINLVAKVKPTIIVIAGDIFDFDAFSSFAKDPRRKSRDAFKEVQGDWDSIVSALKIASPNSIIVAFTGNHDKPRIDRYSASINSPFMSTTEEVFVNMVRSNNRVWWLNGKQETYIGEWFIQHGKKSGETAAKSAARSLGLYGSHSQGHNHTPAMFYTRVNSSKHKGRHYHLQMSASSGCLCNIPPHYVTDTNFATWINGVIVGHVNIQGGPEVNLQNVVFHPTPDGEMWCVFGNDIITSE